MEDRHRIAIQKNYKELVEKTDLSRLLPRLVNNGVFSERMAKTFQDASRAETDRKRDLFAALPRRGPEAFGKLVACLAELDRAHKRLAHRLEGKSDEEWERHVAKATAVGHKAGAHAYRLPCYEEAEQVIRSAGHLPVTGVDLSTEPLQVKVRRSDRLYDVQKEHKPAVYPMRSRHRGALLTINNVEFLGDAKDKRNGAEVDDQNLTELFTQMGFSITSHKDLTKRDMCQAIQDFANERVNPTLSRVDCVFVVVMSHGGEGPTRSSSYVTTHDCQRLEVQWIEDQFTNRLCPALRGKPKVLMFQICRGDEAPPALMVRRTRQDGEPTRPTAIREVTDLLIAFSTLPGHKAFRDIYKGTWYVELLCQMFMQHAHDTDVESLLKMVDDGLAKRMSDAQNMQTASYENRGFKLCFLNPGLYWEDGAVHALR